MTDTPADDQSPGDVDTDRATGPLGADGDSERTSRHTSNGSGGTDPPHVLLLAETNRNRHLLAEFLTAELTVTATDDAAALTAEVDLCLVDRRQLDRHRDAIVARREAVDPVFLPVVLVDSGTAPLSEDGWAVVDEVVQTPISKPVLRARIENLLARRRQSCRLADREAELEVALTELRVRDRAMAEAPIGVTIAGPWADDTPLVYVNDAFCELTGYSEAEALGRNCRFLQGERTDEATRRTLRAALAAAEPVSVDLVNYTRDGEQFWNKVDIAPVRDDDGEVTHFVGFQTDITARKLHEQLVDVLNRFMRHNLRNELNIIDGYRDALLSDVGIDRETALERIGESISRLVGLSEETGHIEQVFSGGPVAADVRPVAAVVDEIADEISTRDSDVTVRVELPDDPVHVSARTLALGCVDYLSTLLDTNRSESPDRRVSIVVSTDDGVVDIALSDDGGGLSETDWHVIEAGSETPLRHTDHLGLWVLRWVTTRNGGELVRAADGTLHVRFPVRAPPPQSPEREHERGT